MPAIEEHKPAEKRRALGRGLDSLLPSGPRVIPQAPPGQARTATAEPRGPAVVPPVVIPAAPANIGDLHAGAEKTGSNVLESHHTEDAQFAGEAPAPHRAAPYPATPHPAAPHGQEIIELPLDLIDENPYQTRRTFNEAALAELAESIRVSGLAQPVVVRPGATGRYVLVLGERRCRASRLAGKTHVAAIVRQLGNEQAAEMTVVENLQRQDLNCLEQAEAFARLSREFNLTQEQIGKRTGVSRESVANYMRLLKLPKTVLGWIGEGKIGFSEARILLEAVPHLDEAGVENLAHEAIQSELTVKELKARLHRLQMPETLKPEPALPKAVDPNVKAAETELQRRLGMRVRITDHRGKGTVLIQYRSVEDFERLLEALKERH